MEKLAAARSFARGEKKAFQVKEDNKARALLIVHVKKVLGSEGTTSGKKGSSGRPLGGQSRPGDLPEGREGQFHATLVIK